MIEEFSLTITNCVEFKDHCTFCIQQIMYSWFSTFQMRARGRHLGFFFSLCKSRQRREKRCWNEFLVVSIISDYHCDSKFTNRFKQKDIGRVQM